MLTLIVLFIAAVVCFVAAALIFKFTYEDELAGFLGAIGSIAAFTLIICSLTLINKERRFDAIQEQYQVISVMVDSYSGQDYGNMSALIDEVVRMNNRIATHKAFYTSPWTGIWYSEKIANLEPIKFSKNPGLKE
jgi:hypothetical protein